MIDRTLTQRLKITPNVDEASARLARIKGWPVTIGEDGSGKFKPNVWNSNLIKITSPTSITTQNVATKVDSVNVIWGQSYSATFARNSQTGDMYIIGSDANTASRSNYFSIQSSEGSQQASYSNWTKYPVDGVKWLEFYCRTNSDDTLSCKTGDCTVFNDIPILDLKRSVGYSQDRKTIYLPKSSSTYISYDIHSVLSDIDENDTVKEAFAYVVINSSNYSVNTFFIYILLKSGRLFRTTSPVSSVAGTTFVEVDTTTSGPIKHIWEAYHRVILSNNTGQTNEDRGVFAVNENNDLYAMGSSENYALGLPTDVSYYTELTYVGNYGEIKKIRHYNQYCTRLLTESGELYHTGGYAYTVSSDNTVRQTFDRVLPEYYFHDIENSAYYVYAIAEKIA